MSDFARSITIDISDSSPSSLIIDYAILTGGQWDKKPDLGMTIKPGDQVSFVNGASDAYARIDGKIVMAPASGGLIEIGWDWPFGAGTSGFVRGESLNDLSVSSQWVNHQSDNPVFQLTISNGDTADLIRKAATTIS